MLNKDIKKLSDTLKNTYSDILIIINEVKKFDKKNYKKICKGLDTKLKQRSEIKIDLPENIDFGKCDILVYEVLNTILDNNNFIIESENDINIICLKKDIEFMEYFKNIVVLEEVIKVFSTFDELKELWELHKIFFYDIKSLVLSYFLITEKNISDFKVMNVLSFLFKDSKIKLQNSSIKNEKKINQITTGIKYEKQKPVNNDNYNPKREYNKSNRFNLITHITNRITIKYIIEKKPQKKKIIHERRETWRHYKNGLVVYVKGCIVNEHLLVS